jgi:hypothetical protein
LTSFVWFLVDINKHVVFISIIEYECIYHLCVSCDVQLE